MNIITKENKFLREKYYYIKHTSGLDIYIVPKELSSSYAIIGTRYGSLNNRFRLSSDSEFINVPEGIAHFLEHKMFENEDGEDSFYKFSKYGAEANAYTSFDKTAYLFSTTGSFYESLEILLDMVTHPYFTKETVDKEQGIISQEIRMGEDNPDRALLFDTFRSMYKDHPVKIDIAGTVESISHITPELLYKCHQAFYNLNNMTLCISGNVDTQKIISICDKCLEPSAQFEVETVYPFEPAEINRSYFSRNMDVSKPLFSIGIKDNDISDDDALRIKKSIAISILTDMLFSRCSTFYNELYEEGIISSSFDCWSEHSRNFSFTIISGESDRSSDVYKRFKEHIESIKASGLSAEDFDRCKNAVYADIVKSFDSTDDIANNFLSYIFEGGDILDLPDIVKTVTLEYTSEVFRDIFKQEHFTFNEIFPMKEDK